ncbi:MAG: hypothetical protein KTV72_04625, partial [Wolbachia endosymbiont of Melophagus ovinus]|nr:hypothetical protein [Wolbachia endosymbiont of Melophagus ovinus]
EILENKRQENRNKIVLLTVPYVLSGLTIVGALAKFGFANIQSWKQWTFIAAVGVIAIVGACITLSKLRNNEVDNACNTVKKLDNIDILLPCRKSSVISVMENKFENKEKDDLQSQALRLFERFLTGFKNDVCNILDKHLIEANASFKECLLNPSNANIDKVLTLIRDDIQALLSSLERIVTKDLNEIKNMSGKAITNFFTSARDELTKKISQLESTSIGSWFFKFSNKGASNSHPKEVSEEIFYDVQDWETQIKNLREDLKKELLQELQKHLEELRNKRTQSTNEPNSSLESNLGKQQDKEKKVREKNELLKSQQRTRELEKENAKLEKELSEQEETDERQEKINGKPSEFLYYVLESIKLEERGDKEKDSKVEATLRNLNNKIIIHWKDGSQTICHIKKQGNLPSTEVDFVDKNIQAAFETACVG